MHSSKLRTFFVGVSAIVAGASILVGVATSSIAASIVGPPSSHNFYGWGTTKVTDASAAGAPAKSVITLTSTAPGAHPWDQGAAESLLSPVTAGEKLSATFYIRAVSPATVTTDFSFEKASAPYKNSVRQTVTAGTTWKKISVNFVSAAAYGTKDAHIVFHTGYSKGSFEVSGLTISPSK